MVPSAEISSNNPYPCIKLDRHSNMVVLGKKILDFDRLQVNTCGVDPFDHTIVNGRKVPIFDVAVEYYLL